MIYRQQLQEFEAIFDMGETGLDGTLEWRIVDGQGAVVSGPTTAGVVESGASGVYTITGTAPGTLGQYGIEASTDGTFAVGTVAHEPLTVIESETVAELVDLAPIEPGAGIVVGPCQAWVDGDTIAEICEGFDGGTATAVLDDYARSASELLFPLSGSIFTGECGPIRVRPCAEGCGCFPFMTAYGWTWDSHVARWRCAGRSCGCSPVSEVRLAGHVREIIEVTIDGDVLDASEYRLDGKRLVRMRDPADPNRRLSWPGCQIIDLDHTEEGTFSILYTYGVDPPQAARDAAAALACQLYTAAETDEECDLPDNVVRVIRSGITFEMAAALNSALGAGATGVPAIDAFVASYGDLRRSSAVWSPDLPWPRRMGSPGS